MGVGRQLTHINIHTYLGMDNRLSTRIPSTGSDSQQEEEATGQEEEYALIAEETDTEKEDTWEQEDEATSNKEDYDLLKEGIMDQLMWPTTAAVLIK